MNSALRLRSLVIRSSCEILVLTPSTPCIIPTQYFVLGSVMENLLSLRSPQEIWLSHRSFLICEIVFYVGALLTLVHGKTTATTVKLF